MRALCVLMIAMLGSCHAAREHFEPLPVQPSKTEQRLVRMLNEIPKGSLKELRGALETLNAARPLIAEIRTEIDKGTLDAMSRTIRHNSAEVRAITQHEGLANLLDADLPLRVQELDRKVGTISRILPLSILLGFLALSSAAVSLASRSRRRFENSVVSAKKKKFAKQAFRDFVNGYRYAALALVGALVALILQGGLGWVTAGYGAVLLVSYFVIDRFYRREARRMLKRSRRPSAYLDSWRGSLLLLLLPPEWTGREEHWI